MGADLYIKSINDEAQKKYRPLFNEACNKRNKETSDRNREALQNEIDKYYDLMFSVQSGYFRDAYNGTSIASQLGFSWWKDVVPMLDEDGNLQPDKIKVLMEMVLSKDPPFMTIEQMKKKHLVVDESDNSPEVWHESFLAHKQELVMFLGLALDRNELIYCSL